MVFIIPLLDIIDEFQLKNNYAPIVMLAATLVAAYMYPQVDEWSTCRGDTMLILGVYIVCPLDCPMCPITNCVQSIYTCNHWRSVKYSPITEIQSVRKLLSNIMISRFQLTGLLFHWFLLINTKLVYLFLMVFVSVLTRFNILFDKFTPLFLRCPLLVACPTHNAPLSVDVWCIMGCWHRFLLELVGYWPVFHFQPLGS